MKEFLIPYAYKKDGYWSALDIHNDSCYESPYTVCFYSHPEGNLLKEEHGTIEANASTIVEPSSFPSRENGRYILRVRGPEHLVITHVYVGPWQMEVIK